ncbi:MAG: hypothetical protein IZT57_02365 [Chloroflexi bacterium]|jgi:hypothetical protein|nr:hypothetical protein [Chloroflexota bacterium]
MEKIVTLCQEGSCCPVIKIKDEQIEVGEEGNLCILKKSEWEVLKQKVLDGEL